MWWLRERGPGGPASSRLPHTKPLGGDDIRTTCSEYACSLAQAQLPCMSSPPHDPHLDLFFCSPKSPGGAQPATASHQLAPSPIPQLQPPCQTRPCQFPPCCRPVWPAGAASRYRNEGSPLRTPRACFLLVVVLTSRSPIGVRARAGYYSVLFSLVSQRQPLYCLPLPTRSLSSLDNAVIRCPGVTLHSHHSLLILGNPSRDENLPCRTRRGTSSCQLGLYGTYSWLAGTCTHHTHLQGA